MSSMAAQPAFRLPVPTLALGAICPGVVVGLASAALWWSRSAEAGQGAAIGAGIAVLAAIGWVVVMGILPARPAARWSLVLVLGSSARMMASLAMALACYLPLRPLETPYWGSFLATALATLVVETLVSISALKRAAQGAEDSPR